MPLRIGSLIAGDSRPADHLTSSTFIFPYKRRVLDDVLSSLSRDVFKNLVKRLLGGTFNPSLLDFSASGALPLHPKESPTFAVLASILGDNSSALFPS